MTEGNKREYINLKAQHYMTTAIKAQLQAFLQGFWDLIPQATPFPYPSYLSLTPMHCLLAIGKYTMCKAHIQSRGEM